MLSPAMQLCIFNLGASSKKLDIYIFYILVWKVESHETSIEMLESRLLEYHCEMRGIISSGIEIHPDF